MAALCAALTSFVPTAVAAQGWTADAHLGRASFDGAPPEARSTSATLGIRHALDERFFQAALAAPLASDELAWGAVNVADRLAFRTGRFEAGVDVQSHGHLHRDLLTEVTGWGVRAEVLPMVSASHGSLIAEVRSGGSWYRAGMDGDAWTRNLWMSDLRATWVPAAAPGRVTGTVRSMRASEARYTYLGASAVTAVGRTSVRAWGGEWVSGLEAETRSGGWGVSGAVRVTGTTDAWASVRSEPVDPIFLSGPRTSWGIGVSYRFGGSWDSPVPRAGAEVREGGPVVIRVPLHEASSPPAVAGDFTGWDPVPMHRRGAEWRIEFSLPPGVYRYAFRADGGEGDAEWFVPEAVPGRRDDGMGGWVAVMIVP